MGTILLVLHQGRREAAKLAADIIDWAGAAGHEVRLPAPDAALVHRPELAAEEPGAVAWDLALSLGGDGTMLRTVDLVAGELLDRVQERARLRGRVQPRLWPWVDQIQT